MMKVCKSNGNIKENDDNDRGCMLVSSISLGEIFRNEVKLNNLPEINGRINSIENVESEDDLEIKMVIGNDIINNMKTVEQAMNTINGIIIPKVADDEIMTRRGSNYAKLIGYNHKAKSKRNRLKVQKSCDNWNLE
ncbi:1888_t:CDS:1 [Dentiscutata erythropus]|uniref:1888_t:CDS:1 n=1 Tax=Dentiscutata erythropus TaxID=1348616 RepID=A0A9N8WLR4_9GLOM|nr:1888_t:CDS:1 [Dentiscutata erythropus]